MTQGLRNAVYNEKQATVVETKLNSGRVRIKLDFPLATVIDVFPLNLKTISSDRVKVKCVI